MPTISVMTGEGAPEPEPRPSGEPPERPRPKRRRRRRRKPSGGQTTTQRNVATRSPNAAKGERDRSTTGKADGAKTGGKAKRTAEGTASEPNRKRARTAATPKARQRARARSGKKAADAPRIPTKKEVSAGGVVYRRTDGGIEVVLASRRTRRGDLAWGLAKGGVEDGETFEQAAVREVREETGLVAEIEADLGDTKYMYVWEDVRIRKTVHFFLMRHVGGDTGDRDDEMEEIRWFPLERALKRSAYRGERDVLARAAELLG
jgi:8-oxo-dGTP pyrophosphatase MutT (NUDIX family)